ncbi:MAG TPA: hypothetical protein DEH25_09685 [Chloroflexi bacterium]|nr:hypothetical protein [Chloroflexota bacterium]
MIAITTVFWIFVVFFAFLGFVRGWAREILVTASVILAFFIIFVMETYIPIISTFFESAKVPNSDVMSIQQFWFRSIILFVLVFFGYETPSIPRISGPRFKRDNFRDSALGFILGGFNGYLIIGTLWAFLAEAGYPFDFVVAPLTQEAIDMVAKLPPNWLIQIPHILIAVILVFFFIIAVFI